MNDHARFRMYKITEKGRKMNKARFKVGDKVKILDGSKIQDFGGGWVDSMDKYIGEVAIIKSVYDGNCPCYKLEGIIYLWDERGLAPAKNEAIIIYRDGQKVIARNKITGKTAEARCNPSDEFVFETGARIALDRLIAPPENESAFKVGDKVKIINTGKCYTRHVLWVISYIWDKKLIARYAYGHDLGYLDGISELNDTFIILAINENKAYISENIDYGPCYLISLDGLKKC